MKILDGIFMRIDKLSCNSALSRAAIYFKTQYSQGWDNVVK